MRYAVLSILMLSFAVNAETASSRVQTATDMRKLADQMQARAVDLKDGTPTAGALSQGRSLEHRLAELIAKLEGAASDAPATASPSPLKSQDSPKVQGEEELTGSSTEPKPSRVSMSDEEWAKLPPAKRAAILQSYHEDLPERWRKRLQAYFLSLGAEQPVSSQKK